MSNVKVGDVVGALVREEDGCMYVMRRGVRWEEMGVEIVARTVYAQGWLTESAAGRCGAFVCDDDDPPSHSVTIVALGLTGQETAADLQRLAETYEVREAMLAWNADERAVVLAHEAAWGMLSEVAERLHAAGFRRGMTAEDAARLLAETCDAG